MAVTKAIILATMFKMKSDFGADNETVTVSKRLLATLWMGTARVTLDGFDKMPEDVRNSSIHVLNEGVEALYPDEPTEVRLVAPGSDAVN